MTTRPARCLRLALVLAAALMAAPTADAVLDPAVSCAAAKQKTAFKKTLLRGICYVRATKKGVPVDPPASRRSRRNSPTPCRRRTTGAGCVTTGDANAVESTVDGFVSDRRDRRRDDDHRAAVHVRRRGACMLGHLPPGASCAGGGTGTTCSCNF